MSQRLERTNLRNGIALLVLFVLLFYLTVFSFFAMAQSTDVHILNLVYGTEELPGPVAISYNYGFNASLSSRNFTLAGRKVNIIPMAPDPGAVASSIEQAVGSSKDLFVVLGPASGPHTLGALPALHKNDVVAFGPLTYLSSARIWNEHLYYLLISAALSVQAFIRHAESNLRVRRLGFMYTHNTDFGAREYEIAKKTMKGMEWEFCGVFSIDGRVSYTSNNKEFNGQWETFAETLPQAVILMSLPNSAAKLFVQKMLQDPRTSTAYFMVPSVLERTTLQTWEKARADGAPTFPGQVIMTATFPSPLDKSSAMAGKFRSAIDEYLNKEVNNRNSQEVANIKRWSRSGVTLFGWVAGEMLFQALSGFNPVLNRKEFISSLYNQRSYIIEEIVVGTFGGNISEEFEKTGAVSRCNEGAATAYMKKYLDHKNSETVHKGLFKHSINDCEGKNVKLLDSSAILMVDFTDVNAIKDDVINEMRRGQDAGCFFLKSESKHAITFDVLQSKYEDSTIAIQKEYKNYSIDVVTGFTSESTLGIPNITFMDPIPIAAVTNTFRRNVVFLSPTVEQQIFVLAEYVASLPDHNVRAIIHTASGHELADILKKSLLAFGVKLTSFVLLSPGDKIENELEDSGLTLMIGVNEADIPIFFAHLEQNTKARLVVLFNPILACYKTFCKAFNGTEAADRLLIITNLPHWADANSPSKMVRSYHKSIKDPSARSPLSLQSFIVGRFIRNAVDKLEIVSWSSIGDYFYSAIAMSLDDMKFGPYADSDSVTCTSGSDPNSLDCAKNFGATSISIWPMSRVFNPKVDVLFGPVTPSMEYPPPSTGLTKNEQIGVILGSLLGAVVLATVLGLLFFYFYMGNLKAPKDPEAPVTLIFTDIQSSTALWAACPQIMPEAVETHHRLIRRLIAKYKCYEVKTVGDSFMIACKSPYAAVQLVGDLQRTFLHHDWETSAIDKAYHEMEERQAEEDEDYKPPTARLDDAVYRRLWNGLRVRAGVHTGLSDIQRDEVTKRYDYYGSNSNTAARTESVANGGQVLLTRAAYMALSTAERAGLNVTALGAVELRGVPEPVEMFQLNPVPGRAFASLRLERANDDFEFDTSSVAGTETSGSVSESLSPAAENLFAVLHDIFAPFPLQQRLKVLEPLCKRWNVPMPVIKNQNEVLAVSHLAEQRLAIKISHVIERRQLTWHPLTDASEILSSSGESFFTQNSSKVSSVRVNLFLKHNASKRSPGSERHGRNSVVSFNLHRGSLVLSGTSSVHVREPSFQGFE